MPRAVALGAVQGVTELVPVSSSAHLVLVPWWFGWEPLVADPQVRKALDVALHVGSLVGALDVVRRLRPSPRTLLLAGIASLPAAAVGGTGRRWISARLGRPWQVGTIAGLTGLAMWRADRRHPSHRGLADIGLVDALALGAAQAAALVPGVSRAGATLTAARSRGVRSDAAGQLSTVMSVPVIAGAGLLSALTLDRRAFQGQALAVLAGAGAAAASSLAGARVAPRLLRRGAAVPAAYRVMLSAAVLRRVLQRKATS